LRIAGPAINRRDHAMPTARDRRLNPPTPRWVAAAMAEPWHGPVPEWRPVPPALQRWYMAKGLRLDATRTMPDGSWEVNLLAIGVSKARTMAAFDALPAWRRALVHEHGNKGAYMQHPGGRRARKLDELAEELGI
jgi:hypothetical protein